MFAGSVLTLNCNIYLSVEVGREVVIVATWKRNGTVLVATASQMASDIVATNTTNYLSQLMFNPLQLGLDDGVYNCEARIDSEVEFVLGSMAQSNYVSLHVGGTNINS